MEPQVAFALAVAITVLVAVGDYLTGPYLAFATVYLLPIGLAAWFAGRRAVLVVALLASALGVLTTAADPGDISPLVNVLNGLLRFVLYGVVGLVLASERQALRTIADLAATDPLTGLANRRRFDELAARELARSKREERPVAVVYIDVDDLKRRNETHGHEAGDALLAEFASVARRELRATDVLARVGGDEFAGLLPGADVDDAAATIERLRSTLATAVDPPITFSAGVAAGVVTDGLTVEPVVHAADLAMLEAKAAGKARTAIRPLPRAGTSPPGQDGLPGRPAAGDDLRTGGSESGGRR